MSENKNLYMVTILNVIADILTIIKACFYIWLINQSPLKLRLIKSQNLDKYCKILIFNTKKNTWKIFLFDSAHLNYPEKVACQILLCKLKSCVMALIVRINYKLIFGNASLG